MTSDEFDQLLAEIAALEQAKESLGRVLQALTELGTGVASGKLKYRETVAQGLENAPEAFFGLLKGRNFGKQLVKLI